LIVIITIIVFLGVYKPRVRCYETSQLSLKFERCFDSEGIWVVLFLLLSSIYDKLNLSVIIIVDNYYIHYFDCHYSNSTVQLMPLLSIFISVVKFAVLSEDYSKVGCQSILKSKYN